MSLDTAQLSKNLLAVFKNTLTKKWPEIKEYGETECKKLAQTLVMIEALIATEKINQEQASLHLEIQKNATRTVLLTLEGMGILAVEAAINAALEAVKQTVNTALGFKLI